MLKVKECVMAYVSLAYPIIVVVFLIAATFIMSTSDYQMGVR